MFDRMDAPPRGALMLVYFTAAALISLSLLEFGLYLAECHKNHAPVGLVYSSLLMVLFVLGVAALIRARAVARWVANKLDE
jgi:hypothetical protein